MYFVYILLGKNGNYYKGITDDINRRLAEHENGYSYTTRKILPIKLIHVEICNDRVEARKIEKYFKSGFGREIISEIANQL